MQYLLFPQHTALLSLFERGKGPGREGEEEREEGAWNRGRGKGHRAQVRSRRSTVAAQAAYKRSAANCTLVRVIARKYDGLGIGFSHSKQMVNDLAG